MLKSKQQDLFKGNSDFLFETGLKRKVTRTSSDHPLHTNWFSFTQDTMAQFHYINMFCPVSIPFKSFGVDIHFIVYFG